jgi:hypothetical protein
VRSNLLRIVILIALLVIKYNRQLSSWTSPHAKDFKDLDSVDRTVVEYDSVYRDYCNGLEFKS